MIATPFLQAASQEYEVTLIAKPFARDLQSRFWPEVKVVPFVAPWTAFRRKYRLHRWPWRAILSLRKLSAERFDYAISARWDPRDHLLLLLLGGRRRLGFPRLRSQIFLTDPLERPPPVSHRYENWRVIATRLGITLPAIENLRGTERPNARQVLVHTGAGQAVRVWPLDHYRQIIHRLRAEQHEVQVACDPDQRTWWHQAGETEIATPRNVSELLALIDRARVFVGNDSGPAHLAAFCGLPTFTIFGPQLYEWFAPMHPEGECLEGKACPFKPCSDYCRFPVPRCLAEVTADEFWEKLERFLWRHSLEAQRRMSLLT